ncbi:uroporphyrinogen-III synthase [Schleiferia thermophila]|uniref:Uroporphyrinogen-III synthase n=1 Tax=Schleiferia thermophila TaxID=884107 RepID=A0A369A3N2_9FLAO|nr:uroporphyrinogen-III synthase [Schleiferia thermophila]RCX03930.1 uroporphyrinogen-III synthase [Schleiferia thermophila]
MSSEIFLLSLKALTRSQLTQLRKLAHEILCIEPFDIEYVSNLPWPENGQISIFTSQKALQAIKMSHHSKYGDYSGYECLCVGSRTGLLAEKMGFTVVYSAKDANDLVRFVDNTYSEQKSFVHYCASDRLNVLRKADVFRARHHFREVVSYHKHLKNLPYTLDSNVVLAFSPSGIAFARRHLNDVNAVRVFCIGATTAQAAREAGFREVLVAEESTVQAVCDLVSKTLG